MWLDGNVVILASGPSMSKEIADTVRYHHKYRVITVNTTFQLAPWADIFYAADQKWWAQWWPDIEKLSGMKVTCSDNRFPDVLQLRVSGKTGFDPDPSCVRTGGNSGYQAIHVAAHTGAKRILLCGYDMKGGHWHGRHADPLRNAGEDIYRRWLENFDTLAPELEQRDIEVINCTPNSALKLWPFQPLEQAIEDARTLSYS
jgi:hypothetical protein